MEYYQDSGKWYNGLELRVKNNLGFQIEIDSISIEEYSQSKSGLGIQIANGDTTDSNIDLDDMTNVRPPAPFYPALPSGEQYEIEFTLTYVHSESDLEHTVKGRIKGKVI